MQLLSTNQGKAMSGVFGRVIKKVETATHILRVYNNF